MTDIDKVELHVGERDRLVLSTDPNITTGWVGFVVSKGFLADCNDSEALRERVADDVAKRVKKLLKTHPDT